MKKTEYTVEKEGYAFGFDDHETILSDMTLHEDDIIISINDYLMEDLEYAQEMTEGQDEIADPKKVKVTVHVTLEEI